MIQTIFARPLRRSLALTATTLLAVVLGACGVQPEVSEIPRFGSHDYNYVIGPGDRMEIFVWGNESLSTSAIIRPDGKLTTRLVEDMQASGKTPTELARDIERAYSEFVRQPVVSVIINGFVGVPHQQVRVVGEATIPSAVPYSQHMTLLDLMIAVGGMTEFASGNNAILVRSTDGRQESIDLRLNDLLRKGRIDANIALRPGDIVIIPESWF